MLFQIAVDHNSNQLDMMSDTVKCWSVCVFGGERGMKKRGGESECVSVCAAFHSVRHHIKLIAVVINSHLLNGKLTEEALCCFMLFLKV